MDNHKISYLEFPSKDIEITKEFFTNVFDWTFTDFGDEYTSFTNQCIGGGFYKTDKKCRTKDGAPLIILYSDSLKNTQQQIEKNGGEIIKPTFSFPGGHRFHFTDPNGNEYAVWSNKGL